MTEEINLPAAEGKVAWLCTYIPEELIRAAGFLPYRPAVRADVTDHKSGYLPGNLCPYVRSAAYQLLQTADEDLSGVVVANSCNAMMHLYNMLREESELPVFMLDLPRRRDERARSYFSECLANMADFLGDLGREIRASTLQKVMSEYQKTLQLLTEAAGGSSEDEDLWRVGFISDNFARRAFGQKRRKINEKLRAHITGNEPAKIYPDLSTNKKFILTGAQPHPLMSEVIEENGGAVFHDHCQGYRYWRKRYDKLPFTAGKERIEAEKGEEKDNLAELLSLLADIYLQKPPCPRFYDFKKRQDFYEGLLQSRQFEGVIFHNLNFCDFAHYDFLRLQEFFQSRNLPVLNLASELSSGDKGQIRTRIEAFIEMV